MLALSVYLIYLPLQPKLAEKLIIAAKNCKMKEGTDLSAKKKKRKKKEILSKILLIGSKLVNAQLGDRPLMHEDGRLLPSQWGQKSERGAGGASGWYKLLDSNLVAHLKDLYCLWPHNSTSRSLSCPVEDGRKCVYENVLSSLGYCFGGGIVDIVSWETW